MMRCHRVSVYLSTWLLAAGLVLGSSAVNAENLTVTLSAGEYRITEKADGEQVIEMDDFGNLLVPGKPMLPAKAFMIALPPGAEVNTVTAIGTGPVKIEGSYRITSAPPFLPADNQKDMVNRCLQEWQQNHDLTYSSDEVYPEQAWKYLGSGGLRKYTFARVAYFPFSYQPQSGRLVFHPSLVVTIDYSISSTGIQETERLLSDKKADKRASELLINYSEAERWYPPVAALRSPEDTYDYVIITTDALVTAVSPLVDWKEMIDYSVNVVTTSWIQSNYSGSDLQETIRNFLIDKYVEWVIEYVLLAGDIDVIPMRKCYPNPSDHSNNDYCPPTDHYYADLTGDWDSDGDGYYGEYGEDNVDFVPEVFVGRIPYSNGTTVTSICEKLVTVESDTSPWKNNVLLLGAMSNYANEDNSGYSRTDGASLMQHMITNMLSSWTYTTMYEKGGLDACTYPCDFPISYSNVKNDWSSNDYGVVNWWGHGGYSDAWRKFWATDDGDGVPEEHEMSWEGFVRTYTCSYLDNDHSSIVFSCSCNNGWPEYNNLAKQLLRKGSAGIVASTRISWYAVGWSYPSHGGNASIDYYFFHYLINNSEKVGNALFDSKVYYRNHFFTWGWQSQENLFDFCLYGDPALVREGVEVGARVVATSPVQNKLSVPVSANTSMTFNAEVNPGTLNDSTLKVSASSSGRHLGAISYDSPSMTATLDPAVDFHAGEVVTVVATTGIESAKGMPLDSSYVWTFTVAVNDSAGTLVLDSVYPAGSGVSSVYAADLDGDDDLDLAVADPASDSVTILLNNGDGTFAPHSASPAGDGSYCVYAADFDGDGILDLATGNLNSSTVSILPGNGDGTFALDSTYPVDLYPRSVFAADLDGDGDPDLATANQYGNNISVLLNNGDGTFVPDADPIQVSGGPVSVVAADLDNDGDLDLAAVSNAFGTVAVLWNNRDGTFVPALGSLPVGAGSSSIFTADIDGDGFLDILTANTDDDNVSVLLNNGDSSFASHVVYAVGDNPVSVAAADFNGDGYLDILTANQGSNDISVLWNNGDSTFAPHVVDNVAGTGPASGFAADLDRDGDLDVVTANSASGDVSVLMNMESCCVGLTGNVDNDPADIVDIGDLTRLIDYLFITYEEPECMEEANANGDPEGIIDIGDLTSLIDYLFISYTPPAPCQ